MRKPHSNKVQVRFSEINSEGGLAKKLRFAMIGKAYEDRARFDNE